MNSSNKDRPLILLEEDVGFDIRRPDCFDIDCNIMTIREVLA